MVPNFLVWSMDRTQSRTSSWRCNSGGHSRSTQRIVINSHKRSWPARHAVDRWSKRTFHARERDYQQRRLDPSMAIAWKVLMRSTPCACSGQSIHGEDRVDVQCPWTFLSSPLLTFSPIMHVAVWSHAAYVIAYSLVSVTPSVSLWPSHEWTVHSGCLVFMVLWDVHCSW